MSALSGNIAAPRKRRFVVLQILCRHRVHRTGLRIRIGQQRRIEPSTQSAGGRSTSRHTRHGDTMSSAVAVILCAGEGARIGAKEVKRAFPRLADERTFAFTDAVRYILALLESI